MKRILIIAFLLLSIAASGQIGRIPYQTFRQLYHTDTIDTKIGTTNAEYRTNLSGFQFNRPLIIMDTSLNDLIIAHASGELTGYWNKLNLFARTDSVSPYLTRIGYKSGYNLTTGLANTFIGYSSGQATTYGSSNTFLGSVSGYSNTTGHGNVYIGRAAGYRGTTASHNVIIGDSAGINNTTSVNNTFVGSWAGNNCTGQENVFLGFGAGRSNTTANYNTFIGTSAGYNTSTGCCNVALGNGAGGSNNVGVGNVFLGYSSGYYETGSNKLYIANSNADSSNALIYGSFTNKNLRFNGSVNITKAFIDSSLQIKPRTTVPLIASEGKIYYDNSEHLIKYYNGTIWNKFWTPLSFFARTDSVSPYLTRVGYKSGYSNTTGYSNTYLGYMAGMSNTTGYKDIFVGDSTGLNSTGSMNVFVGRTNGLATTGNHNTFVGNRAGMNVTSGTNNVILGSFAGYGVTTGTYNFIVGDSAGYKSGLTGNSNNFIGYQSGYSNTTGYNNNFIGSQSGHNNTTGYNNNFIGFLSGYSNITGYNNNFIGFLSGRNNTTGYTSNFIGYQSGYSNTTGYKNIFIGSQSGYSNTTGYNNNFIGSQSGYSNTTGYNNNFIGDSAGYNCTGSNNIMIGHSAGKNQNGSEILVIDNKNRGSSYLEIHKALMYGEFNTDSSSQYLRVNGYMYATGTTSGTGTALVLGTDGRLYINTSSEQFKTNIKDFVPSYLKLLQLNPVSFNYWKTDILTDSAQIAQNGSNKVQSVGDPDIGYIAEQFDSLGLSDLLIYKDGKPFSIKYEKLPLYIIELLKDHEKRIQAIEEKLGL